VGNVEGGDYEAHFAKLTSLPPYGYQLEVARHLFDGRNVVLRAPTGAGKTMAVLVPFLFEGWPRRPSRLIYALPLRTLAQGVYHEALDAARKLGKPVGPIIGERGRETVSPFVTLQTGEQPDDPFFERGRIIVTTYDQVLSGLLCGPYGLSDRLHNINAAAIAGALVVFDEFHLMAPDKAFLTAVAGLRLFKHLCQSVWMTATATAPLEQMLRDELDAMPVPDGETSARQMLDSLPSVTSVQRRLQLERGPLTAEAVLRNHDRRSIVLANTVGRAQALFEALRSARSNKDVELLLLHSRFFKGDRQRKEEKLQRLFGKTGSGSAILVATQVIEAGMDISSEHLHTELCPMNSLVQRAGRCARFIGEAGIVHVYELPDAPRAWLPYGELDREAPTLTATRDLLSSAGPQRLDPELVAKWVEAVHSDSDRGALREGCKPRLEKVLDLIAQKAIRRDVGGIAHLIRGADSESIRVIVADDADLPESPGRLESLSLLRWSLAPHIDPQTRLGWYWDTDATQPWKPLINRRELAMTYAVCIRPEFAGYDNERGLRLGQPGTTTSPPRNQPPRPGYAPLREEPWLNHARLVAEAAEKRLRIEGFPEALLAAGFHHRYALAADDLLLAARVCGLLHDLGKLQVEWQRWAEAMQRSKDLQYDPNAPLAHTDFDPDNPEDRQRASTVTETRPPHAAASAYYCLSVLENALASVRDASRPELASACVAAVLAHHGSWMPKATGNDLGLRPLIRGWEQMVAGVTACEANPVRVAGLAKLSDKRGLLHAFLEQATKRDRLSSWWPLVAYLTRTLRLSDQRATSEWACRE
jgi:CRISPR-associated endonuclease/helicase Cas3